MSVRYIFNPDSAVFPSGSFPELKTVAMGASGYQRVLAFDDTNTERCLFSGIAASGWSGSITASVFSRADSGTTASMVWELSVDKTTPGAAMSGSTFAATSSGVAGTIAGGSGLQSTTLTPADDGAVAGDKLIFLLRRLSTHTSDTMTGDMFFTELVIADGG